jgi:pilus assembly protein Flp/PilA
MWRRLPKPLLTNPRYAFAENRPFAGADGVAGMRKFLKLVGDEKGGTAIEYGLILALVVIAMIAALVLLADTTTEMWTGISDNVIAATKE